MLIHSLVYIVKRRISPFTFAFEGFPKDCMRLEAVFLSLLAVLAERVEAEDGKLLFIFGNFLTFEKKTIADLQFSD